MSTVSRDRSGWVTRWDAEADRPADPAQHLKVALSEARANGGGDFVLWVESANDELSALAEAAGLEPWRELLQMRCVLPTPETEVTTRAFEPADTEAFLAVNNRAFAWHPEQGNMSAADFAAQQREDWFDADGFRVHEHDGRLVAFCWTKIHPADERRGDPALGEIYVIAVDPDFHGRGLGKALTLAGLSWLSNRGLRTGMLYVEHDNVAAVHTYERIGFTVHHVDRAYRATLT